MRLRQIEIFHATYVSGSVSQAAKALNVSQPTVSKVLKHAESQLGFELFHREKGRIYPTDKGNLLFERTLPVFEQINELRKYAAVLASASGGQLRISMTPAFGLQIVPRALGQFAGSHKDVAIEIETLHAMEISKALLGNMTDIGLALDAVPVPGLKSETIGMTRVVCVAPTGFGLEDKTVNLSDLRQYPLIQLNAKSPLGQRLNAKLVESWGGAPQNQITAETYHLAKQMAVEGAGIAVVDGITAFSGSTAALTIHKIDDFEPVKVNLLTRQNEPLTAFKADFIDILRNELSAYD